MQFEPCAERRNKAAGLKSAVGITGITAWSAITGLSWLLKVSAQSPVLLGLWTEIP